MPSIDYVRTDTAEDAVSSLELAADFLQRAAGDDRYWKWFVVALHAGAQSMFALTLEAGNGFLVQKPGVMRAMLAAHESSIDAQHPHPHMDNFWNLYKQVQRAENLRSPDCLPLESSPGRDHAHKSLDYLRNNFLHFNTKSWSIERECILESARGCTEVTEFILSRSGAIFWHEDSHQQRAVIALQHLHALLHKKI